MTTIVHLGNLHPIQTEPGVTVDPGQPIPHKALDLLDHHTTTMVFPAEWGHNEIADSVAGIWRHHSLQAPGWVLVESADDAHDADTVERILRAQLGIPDAPDGPTMLLTNAGLDFVSKQLAGSASANAVAKWIALTANVTAPSVSDTTLTGEITTGGGGLIRAAATYAHTGSASTYTLTNTFTANGSDSLPVTIGKVGNFDASAAGNMVFETLISPTATLSASGDSLPLTWTVTV